MKVTRVLATTVVPGVSDWTDTDAAQANAAGNPSTATPAIITKIFEIFIMRLWISLHQHVAEREGFEPSIPYEYAGFRNRCFRPLSHLSRDKPEGLSWPAIALRSSMPFWPDARCTSRLGPRSFPNIAEKRTYRKELSATKLNTLSCPAPIRYDAFACYYRPTGPSSPPVPKGTFGRVTVRTVRYKAPSSNG